MHMQVDEYMIINEYIGRSQNAIYSNYSITSLAFALLLCLNKHLLLIILNFSACETSIGSALLLRSRRNNSLVDWLSSVYKAYNTMKMILQK